MQLIKNLRLRKDIIVTKSIYMNFEREKGQTVSSWQMQLYLSYSIVQISNDLYFHSNILLYIYLAINI